MSEKCCTLYTAMDIISTFCLINGHCMLGNYNLMSKMEVLSIWWWLWIQAILGALYRAWQINKINRINNINNELFDRCKLGLRLMLINSGLTQINNRLISVDWFVIKDCTCLGFTSALHWASRKMVLVAGVKRPLPFYMKVLKAYLLKILKNL